MEISAEKKIILTENEKINKNTADILKSTKIIEKENKTSDNTSKKKPKKKDKKSSNVFGDAIGSMFKRSKLGTTVNKGIGWFEEQESKISNKAEKMQNEVIAASANALAALTNSDVRIDPKELSEQTDIESNEKLLDKLDSKAKDLEKEKAVAGEKVLKEIQKDLEKIKETKIILKEKIAKSLEIVNNSGSVSGTTSNTNDTTLGNVSNTTNISEITEDNHTEITEIKEEQTTNNREINNIISDNHTEIKQDLDKIYKEVYTNNHKQDTSITKKTSNKLDCIGNKQGINPAIAAAPAASMYPDMNWFKPKPTKPNVKDSNNTKKPNKYTKALKDSKAGKGVMKAVATAQNAKSTVTKTTASILEKTKNMKAVSKVADTAKTVSKGAKVATSAAKGAGKFVLKKLPIIGQAVTLGLGALDYANAEDDKGRKDAVGETAGAMTGGAGGAAIGATLGSVVPIVGTLIGGVVGFGVGAFLGSEGCKYLMDKFFGDIDDTISDKDKESPFTFAIALKSKRDNLVKNLPYQTPENQEKAKELIQEADERIIEVTSKPELQDYMETQIDKAQEKTPGITKEKVVTTLIAAAEPEYQKDMIEIYNKKIVGGWFSTDGDLSIADIKKYQASTQTTKSTKSNKNISTINEGNTDTTDTINKSNSKINTDNITNNSSIHNKSNSKINTDSITNIDKSNGVNINNNTKQLINNTDKGDNIKVIEKTLQPIISNNVSQSQPSGSNSVALGSFTEDNQNIIASEMLGGI